MAARLQLLTAADLLSIWEFGERQHPVCLAVELLQRALPEVEAETLWKLPVGRRDALLLELRERTFGSRLRLFSRCPGCREELELELTTRDLRAAPLSAGALDDAEECELRVADFLITYRLPTSADLLAIAGCADRDAAMRALIARCIWAQGADGAASKELPAEVVLAVAEQMAERDPQGETLVTMSCPACDTTWQAAVEVSRLLLKELQIEAERLVDEVHALAAAYGWSEQAIVAMSARKRRAYLSRCGVS